MFDLNALDQLPDAPFLLEHNGIPSFGGLVQPSDDGFTVYDGARTLEVDQTYDAVVEGSRVVFNSRQYRSTLAFRPLRETDKELLIDKGASVQSLEQLVDVINEMFSSAQ